MNTTSKLPYAFAWSPNMPHIAWADIHSNGVLTEIAVMGVDNRSGDLYFIPIVALDTIDRERLLKIISKRDAGRYELWDLMSSTTLKNGINALEYFNQLVKVRSVSGQIFTPNAGRVGATLSSFSQKPVNANVPLPPPQEQTYADAETADSQPAKKGPGRPPATKK